uniref:ADP-ribosylation factor-related protein 1 n=1 Tax=Steinernema glaseri TaxID=37863 RepID=A0A1I7ZY41_9BILA
MTVADLEGAVLSADPTVLTVVIGIFVVAVSIFIIFFRRCFSSKADTILVTGLNGSGKTVLFSRLVNQDSAVKTYTSLAANEYNGYLNSSGRSLRLVDYPGAERLRKQMFSKYCTNQRNTLRGIVMVVDSSTFVKQARDVAELLYDVIFESGSKVPVLVVCNKQDLTVSKSAELVKGALEREMGLINSSREASLKTTDGSDSRRILTDSGEDFSWDELPKTGIQFTECTAQSEEEGQSTLSSVVEWIDSL